MTSVDFIIFYYIMSNSIFHLIQVKLYLRRLFFIVLSKKEKYSTFMNYFMLIIIILLMNQKQAIKPQQKQLNNENLKLYFTDQQGKEKKLCQQSSIDKEQIISHSSGSENSNQISSQLAERQNSHQIDQHQSNQQYSAYQQPIEHSDTKSEQSQNDSNRSLDDNFEIQSLQNQEIISQQNSDDKQIYKSLSSGLYEVSNLQGLLRQKIKQEEKVHKQEEKVHKQEEEKKEEEEEQQQGEQKNKREITEEDQHNFSERQKSLDIKVIKQEISQHEQKSRQRILYEQEKIKEFPSLISPLIKIYPQIQPKEQISIIIKSYHTKTFMKIETQIYEIDIFQNKKSYTIERRFSQFESLFQILRWNYPGIILYPFPDKNVDILKAVKLSMASQSEKVTIIEKRLVELERLLLFLVQHPILSKCIIFEIFLLQNNQQYTKKIKAYQSRLEQTLQKLRGQNKIKKALSIGFGYLKNLVNDRTNEMLNQSIQMENRHTKTKLKESNLQFHSMKILLQTCLMKASSLKQKISLLMQNTYKNTLYEPMDITIDSVLSLSSKLTSCRKFYEQLQKFLDDSILDPLIYYQRLFSQIISIQTQQRKQLVTNAENSLDDPERIKFIIDILDTFDQNFKENCSKLFTKYQQDFNKLSSEFFNFWQFHRKQMCKIWK